MKNHHICNRDNMDAFVYCLTNESSGHKYVGYHKGYEDDGYVCSSQSERFWADYEKDNFSRQIIAKGSVENCVSLEKAILENINLRSDEWYNNSAGGSIVYTKEIRDKMSDAHKTRTHYAIGWKMSNQAKKKMSEAKKRFAESLTEEERKKHFFNNKTSYKQNNSIAECPHCGKEGQYRAMKRWHFDKCREISNAH